MLLLHIHCHHCNHLKDRIEIQDRAFKAEIKDDILIYLTCILKSQHWGGCFNSVDDAEFAMVTISTKENVP